MCVTGLQAQCRYRDGRVSSAGDQIQMLFVTQKRTCKGKGRRTLSGEWEDCVEQIEGR